MFALTSRQINPGYITITAPNSSEKKLSVTNALKIIKEAIKTNLETIETVTFSSKR